MNILFICTANRDRSKSLELYYQNKYPLHRFRSAGINKYLSERHGGIHLKEYMLKIADLIICCEYDHINYITDKINSNYVGKTKVINLGDTSTFMSKEMIDKIENNTKLKQINFKYFDNNNK
jgi:predicted protein tyrosine phosphatase